MRTGDGSTRPVRPIANACSNDSGAIYSSLNKGNKRVSSEFHMLSMLPVLTFLFPLHAHDRAHARTTLAHGRGTRIAGRTRAADLGP